MYTSSSPSMSSSSSQKPMSPTSSSRGLTRYVSAPGTLLSTAVVDSHIGSQTSLISHHCYFAGSTSAGDHSSSYSSSSFITESTCKVNSSNDPNNNNNTKQQDNTGLRRSHGFNDIPQTLVPSSSSLLRQRSSPAGFLSHFTSDNGFSVTRETGNYNSQCNSNGGLGLSRLKSQLSFTGQDSLSQICEFSMPQTSLEMATVEKLLHIPEDSVACKIRAKRGCATHPRSIAERERRTRISGKLKKLQDLVPNMDKQTSYADMLDLAVHHIKDLQNQVQNLHKELEHCTCGCKPNS